MTQVLPPRKTLNGSQSPNNPLFIRAVLDKVSTLVIILDSEGYIHYFNPACEKLTGYSASEVTHQKIWDILLISEEVELTKALLNEIAVEHAASTVQTSWITRTGERRLISWSNAVLQDDPNTLPLIIGTGIDITELHQAQIACQRINEHLELCVQKRTQELINANAKLEYLAYYDPLTRLPNRTSFLNRLKLLMEAVYHYTAAGSAANPHSTLFAVCLIDIDNFKKVKYTLGHLVADQLLIATANRLRSSISNTHILARIGDDEFTFLLEEIENQTEVIKVVEQIHRCLATPFYLNGHQLFITASIGIVLEGNASANSGGYGSPEDFLRAADTAMITAKMQGKGRYAIFNPTMHSLAVSRLQLETDLRHAIDANALEVYYQPIIALKNDRIMGFEALVRWRHPHRSWISPEEFIPIAEETGLIIPLGNWVLRTACRQLKCWQEEFPKFRTLTMSVNVSGIQLLSPQLLEQIDEILAETHLNSHYLKLEITESVLLKTDTSTTTILQQLKSRQIQLCMDDFGTGYSSLSYLHCWPMDTLKIDRSFISGRAVNDKSGKFIETMITLAHHLGMEVIAEGIETPQQLEQLQVLSCDYGQGYLFSKPVDAWDAMAMLIS